MVITELKDKLDNEFKKHYNIILVNGTWGIGKTHYLKEYLYNKKYIYISLFGIDKLEGIKYAIYYELNKIGASINKFINNNSNRDVGISFLTLPIPNISSDIQKKIEKKLKKESLILVIDDLERKSDNINTKELLGFIESLSEIENIKIIVVANEEYIEDKDIYDIFKEKVINKTYNITQYSNEAINEICKQYINNNSIVQIISNSNFFDTVIEILTEHKIKNLRTLKKAILFSKIFLTKFDNNIIKEYDKLDLIKICFAVVIEDCDNLYLKIEKEKSLEECILKHYFNDTFISGKLGIIRPIINIYKDDDIEINYKKALDYYIGKYSVTTNEKDIFYCSEQEVEERLNAFVDNNIKQINHKIDINVWFKELNNLYPWAEKINKKKIFDEKEILSAIDKYKERINTNENLYNIIDRTLPFHLSHKDMEKYYNNLKSKVAIYYFKILIENIKKSMTNNKYDVELIRNLFDTLSNSYVVDEITRNEIIKMIETNDFFVPNINDDISENQWHWCHVIWEKCSIMSDESIKNKLYSMSQKIMKKYTIIGKYRINSLNEQYHISKIEVGDVKND